MSTFLRLVSIILLCSALVCEAAKSAAGRWERSIQIPGSEFPLIVDLERVAGKTWAGSIIIPGLGVNDVVFLGSRKATSMRSNSFILLNPNGRAAESNHDDAACRRPLHLTFFAKPSTY